MWTQKFGSVSPAVYDGHNKEVKELIPRNQLLIYDVRDGWEPLCRFLDVPVPNDAFPRLNDSQAMRTICKYLFHCKQKDSETQSDFLWLDAGMMAFGLFYWIFYAAAAGGLAFLAVYPEATKHLVHRALDFIGSIWTRAVPA